MSERLALVIDRDAGFVDLLRRCLGPYGFEIGVLAGVDALARGLDARPEMLFIGVEAPEREGFQIFSRIKALARGLPVLLATGSVPPDEMAMHHKLSVHADAYLDKRGLGEAELRRAVEQIVKLGPRVRGWAAAAGGAPVPARTADSAVGAAPPGSNAAAALLRAAGLDAHDSAAIAALLDQPAPAGGAQSPRSVGPRAAGSVSAEPPEMADLLAQMADLQRELQSAREAARGSPFSREFLDLRELAERQEKEIIRLKEEAAARAARDGEADRRVRELARALLQKAEEQGRLQRQAQESSAEVRKLEAETVKAKAEAARGRAEVDELAKAKAEAERLMAESVVARADAERLAAEAVAAKADAERLAAEAERMAAEAVVAKAEAEGAAARHAEELLQAREQHARELEEQQQVHFSQMSRFDEAVLERSSEPDLEADARVAGLQQELATVRGQIEELQRSLVDHERRAREDEATIASLRELVSDFSGGLRAHEEKSN